ncbi:MAG: hypothetical protein JNG89_01115, partial [Planctomycetaceae bacterium]|nr:hypothetical protein [Planctomycetaceae bacterium]
TTLTVNDVAPSLGTITLPAVNEGQAAVLTFDVTDPGGDAFVVQVDWGDGNGFVTVTGTAVGGGTVHFAVTSPGTFVQNGLYTLQVRVLDTALTTVHSTASPVLTVNDVAPIIAPAAISLPAINEGQSTTLSFTYFDPGLLDTHTIEVDWGDGAGYVDVTASGFTVTDGFGTHLFTVNSPVYGQDGNFTVRIRVTDTVTASVGTAATSLTVSDVSPVIDPLSISLPAINEGQSTTLIFAFFDPGLSDTFTVEVDWGTGGGFVTVSAANVVSNGAGNHTVTVTSPAFAQDGFFTVQMRVTDAVRPASLDIRQAILLVVDIPPAIDAGSILLPAINEGQRPTLSFDVIDPGVLDLFVVQVDWGDGNGFVTVTPSRLLGGARQFSATAPNPFVQDGSRTIQIRVLDTALTTVLATASPTLTVLDVAPAINPASVALPSITEGQSAALSFDFFDPGLSDTFQVEVDWGTGAGFANMTGAGVLTSDGAGNHTFTVTSPAFVQDGSFTVNIRLTDAVLPAAVSTAVGTLTVTNVAPQIVSVVVLPGAINEGDAVTVRVTFVDPGLADFDPAVPVTVSIDWGDHAAGVPVLDVRSVTLTRLATGQYSFDVTRVFPDDGPSTNPTDINNVTIQFADNVAVAALAPGLPAPQVTVNNLPPTITSSLNPVLVDSIGVVTLNLEFADRGILDALVPDLANWDWGGRGVQLGPPTITTTGTGTFLLTARFQFTENPPAPGPTALNPIPHFTIQFAVVDKDGGLSIGTIDANVPSGIARFQPEAPAPAPPLNPPQSIAQTVPSAPQSSVVVTNESQAPSSSQSSVESTSAKVVLREVLPSGRERLLGSFDENSLDAVLDQLKGLPDRRYRVYMVMPDGSERLIVDVLVREGKPTDPAADSRDASPQRQAPANSDRNLWSDSPQQAPESTETTAPGDAGDPAAGAPSDSGEDADADAAATGQSDNAGVAAEQIVNQGIGVVRRSPAAERELAEPVGPRLP